VEEGIIAMEKDMSVKEVDPKLCFSFSVCSTESKNELIKISKQHLK